MTVLPDPVLWASWQDPEAVFLALESRHPDVFWLDAGPEARTGWSWVGFGDPVGEDSVRRAVANDRRPAGAREAGRFTGGWVGWTGYEPAAGRAGAPVAGPDGDAPDAAWIETRALVAFDHELRQVYGYGLSSEDVPLLARQPPRAAAPDRGAAHARHEPDEYAALVEECRSAIREGDAYQLCLTTRFWVEGEVDAVGAYLALRRATSAHHGGLIRCGGAALLSASPERFLEVTDDVVRTHPIKGTRPRGVDPASDEQLARELRESPKERAENVMIVDLMRNDLARVCLPATVTVERLLEVESYPAVHQLVSTVAGALPAGTTVGDLLDAAFPAGSMTGAPKLSAMTILHRLERRPRGVFSGCFGWVGVDGGLDLAMVIRSIVVHPSGAYVGAGGGITWGSVAADEVAEVGVKARAPLAALGATLPPGW